MVKNFSAARPLNLRAVSIYDRYGTAASDARDSSWVWLGAEIQLALESRVLGQSLPSRRLLEVTEHAGISSDIDAVEPDAWLQRGIQLLGGATHVTDV
jgi:hypothetical protein